MDIPTDDGTVCRLHDRHLTLMHHRNHSTQLNVQRVIVWARDHLLVERPELFAKGNSVYVNSCAAGSLHVYPLRMRHQHPRTPGALAFWCWLTTQTGS